MDGHYGYLCDVIFRMSSTEMFSSPHPMTGDCEGLSTGKILHKLTLHQQSPCLTIGAAPILIGSHRCLITLLQVPRP